MNNIAYLFDLDGVVIDTETEYTKIWTEIGNKYIPHINNFAFQIKGSHIRNIYENYLSHLSEQEWDGVVSYIRDLGQKMNYTYIEGAKEFLQELKIKNPIKQYIIIQ